MPAITILTNAALPLEQKKVISAELTRQFGALLKVSDFLQFVF